MDILGLKNYGNLADNIFKCTFFYENLHIWITISLSDVPKGLIDDKSALFQLGA